MDSVKLQCGETRDLLWKQHDYPSTAQVPGITVASSSATASIASNGDGTSTMTVTVLASGYLSPGNQISGSGIPPNVNILTQLLPLASGESLGGVGRYQVTKQTTFASGAITADGSGPWAYKQSPLATFQANVDGTSGTQTATVAIDISNDGVHPCATAAGTIALSGTISASDGFSTNSSWKYVRARVTAISGTGAVVTCQMGT